MVYEICDDCVYVKYANCAQEETRVLLDFKASSLLMIGCVENCTKFEKSCVSKRTSMFRSECNSYVNTELKGSNMKKNRN